MYEVHKGDWLWYVAERFLGDPERYPEIAALNPHLITDTAGVHGPDHIERGWRLILDPWMGSGSDGVGDGVEMVRVSSGLR